MDGTGDRHVAAQREEAFNEQIGKVERMLGHYIQTGESLDIEY